MTRTVLSFAAGAYLGIAWAWRHLDEFFGAGQ